MYVKIGGDNQCNGLKHPIQGVGGWGEGGWGEAVVLATPCYRNWSSLSTRFYYDYLIWYASLLDTHFSKVPKHFRTRKAIAKSRSLFLQSCFINVFLI